LGLGKAKVQALLARHGITRVLAEEGGRTSRGSLQNMGLYVACLNQAHSEEASVDLDGVEKFWVDMVLAYFAGKPFKMRLDSSLGLRAVIRHLLAQAESRQKDVAGATFHGTMLQHLVGAKLELVLGQGKVQHHGASQNDAGEGRYGDFEVGDAAFHVSTAPGEALIRKCKENLEANRRPFIVTLSKGALVAEGLANNAGVADRIDILEVEQFLATNIHELGLFEAKKRRVKIEELVTRYNEIVSEHETDPSLRIEIPSKK
jgi:hypothetical protein